MRPSFYSIAVAAIAAAVPGSGLAAEVARTAAVTHEREEQILGKPPRIQPVSRYSEEMRALATPPHPFPQVVPDMLATIMHNPELLRRFVPVMRYFLVDSTLPARDRELAILRSAWLMQAPYVWGEHVKIAKESGVRSEEIEWIIEGSAARGWSDHDRAVVKATEELHHDVMISDVTWNTLAKTLNNAQLIELPLLLGQYRAVANLQNSVRMSLRPGSEGLSAR
jgi:alkylhydroperoxidase family enzyme